MSEKEISTKLEELNRLLQAHPRGVKLPTVEEAKKLNHHLQWLTQRLEPDSGGTKGLAEDTVKRMRSALDSLARVIQEKANSNSTDIVPILGAYLEDLPALASTSPALAAAQVRYWELQRARVVEQVASIIKRRHEVGSPPIDTLGEVVSKLRDIEQEIGRCKVFGPQARKDLLQQIQTAPPFARTARTQRVTQRLFA